MPARSRLRPGPRPVRLTVLAGVLLLVGAGTDEAESARRLRSMPREQRLYLAGKIRQFDSLPRDAQAAVRALDARLASLPAADRDNYVALLRRYHFWLSSLTEEQRATLAAAPPETRLALVAKLRAEGKPASAHRLPPLFFQIADLNGPSPFDVAQRLKVWLEMTPAERAAIERLDLSDRQQQFFDLAQAHKVKAIARPSKAEEDALIAKMEALPELKNIPLLPYKRADLKDTKKQQRFRQRVAENFYFVDRPPARVEPENLLRFESALPTWYRSAFDHLPPEEARRRLSILYRLIFPSPEEMPIPKKPAADPSKGAPKAAPRTAPGVAPAF